MPAVTDGTSVELVTPATAAGVSEIPEVQPAEAPPSCLAGVVGGQLAVRIHFRSMPQTSMEQDRTAT